MKPKRLLQPLSLSLVLIAGLLLALTTAVLAKPLPPPEVVALNPEPNSFTAPRTTTVSVEYDQPISPTTVNYQTFAVHAMQTGWLTQNLAVVGGEIILSPLLPFHPGELVQASATTGTLSMGGQGPISPTVWQSWAGVDGGFGTLYDSGQRLGNDDSFSVALGDLDGDGDLDAFVGDFGGGPSEVYFNDGTGVFSDSGQLLGSNWTNGIVLGDLDGDGDLDAFEAYSRYLPNKVWWNDGSGMFTDSLQSIGNSSSRYPALGDLDGDGDLDVFVPNSFTQTNKVYFNNGSGIFTDSGQSLGLESSTKVSLGDLDGDGDLDAFVNAGHFSPAPNTVWMNDGTGYFTDSGQLLGNGESIFSALGDLDGDGDLDAYVTNLNVPAGGEPDEVWLNDGSGNFTLNQSVGNEESIVVELGDLDHDNDLDALVCSLNGGKIWLNDGNGNFTDSGQSLNLCVFPALGDLDGDGDLDAFFANSNDFTPWPNEVWFNGLDVFMPAIFKP